MEELVKAELELARERFLTARDDFQEGRYTGATVACYFGVEHLVRAALHLLGSSPRADEGVLSLFSLHFVRSGRVPPHIGRYLGNLCERRLSAEYDPLRSTEFTREEVAEYIRWAREVSEAVIPFLKEKGVAVERVTAAVERL